MWPVKRSLLLFSAFLWFPCLGGPWSHHVPEPSNQPPLNGTEEEFGIFRNQVVHSLHAAFDASDWKFEKDIGDGINISHRFDPDGGCPFLRGEAILENCSLNRTSDYIIINPRPTDWVPGYSASNTEFRKFRLSNGSMSLNWHWEHDSAFLRNRAYWGLTGWQWSLSGASIEDFTVAIHGDEPAPSGLATGLRSTEWALHRLSDDGNGGSKYEVLWFDDLHGIVPCRLTVGSQVKALRKEVGVYRRILLGPSASELVL